MRVLTLGTFDILHRGHVRLFERCRDLAGVDEFLVGVNSDGFVARYKGRAPVLPIEDRLAVVEACRDVDRAMVNDGPGRDLIEAVTPDIIAIGSDWQNRDYLAQIDVTREWLDERAIQVVYLPYTEGISSSLIRERLA